MCVVCCFTQILIARNLEFDKYIFSPSIITGMKDPYLTGRLRDFRGAFHYAKDSGNFGPNSEWKGSFRFLLTGICRITSGGDPHILVGIFRPKFAVPYLTNRFFTLIREFSFKKIKTTTGIFISWPFSSGVLPDL